MLSAADTRDNFFDKEMSTAGRYMGFYWSACSSSAAKTAKVESIGRERERSFENAMHVPCNVNSLINSLD